MALSVAMRTREEALEERLSSWGDALREGEPILKSMTLGVASHADDFKGIELLRRLGVRRPDAFYGELRGALDEYAFPVLSTQVKRLEGLPSGYFGFVEGARAVSASVEVVEVVLLKWELMYKAQEEETRAHFSRQETIIYHGPDVLKGDVDYAVRRLGEAVALRHDATVRLMGVLGGLNNPASWGRTDFYSSRSGGRLPLLLK